MANLKLKEQPQETETPVPEAGARFHARFAKPGPATATERLVPPLKRLALILLFATIAVAAFLAIPFRQWDHYADWEAIQDTLIMLESRPDSLTDMRRLHSEAEAAGILWDEPTGPRPEKWSQRLQCQRYDAAYGVVQTLALGIIQQGNISRGLDELGHLHQRTGTVSIPNIPSTDQLKITDNRTQQKTTCTACKAGRIETPCTACNGQGWTTVSSPPKKPFPLKATLRNTRSGKAITPAKMQENTTERQGCFSCKGTGKQATPCPSCGERTPAGKVDTAQFALVSGLLADSVKGTLHNIGKGMTLWRTIHTFANMQRTLIGDTNAAPGAQRTHDASFPQPAATSGANPLAYVQAACETLLENPLSEPDMQTLADIAKAETNPPDLRNLAMSAYGISLILRNNPDTYRKVCAIQKSTFGEPYPAPFFTESDYIADCEDCQGKGEKLYPCPTCMSPNADTPPPACTRCKGKKNVTASCATCRGEKKAFKPSDRVRAAYGKVLADIITRCDSAVSESPAALDATPTQETRLLAPVLIILGTALPIALLVYFIMRRKRAQQFSSLPGMQGIDTDKFTDPLSLSAQESRNSVKRKTARIPIPDEYNQTRK